MSRHTGRYGPDTELEREWCEADAADHAAWLAQEPVPPVDSEAERRERFWRERAGVNSYWPVVEPDVRENL